MKRLLLLAGLVLLGTSLAMAQSMPQQQSDQTGSASAASGTIKGCLSGSNGSYMLTQDETGASFRLVGKDDKLKSHVGHEVMVTGQVMSASSAGTTAEAQGDTAAAASSSGAGGNAMQVSDVKMVSKHCEETGAPQSH